MKLKRIYVLFILSFLSFELCSSESYFGDEKSANRILESEVNYKSLENKTEKYLADKRNDECKKEIERKTGVSYEEFSKWVKKQVEERPGTSGLGLVRNRS